MVKIGRRSRPLVLSITRAFIQGLGIGGKIWYIEWKSPAGCGLKFNPAVWNQTTMPQPIIAALDLGSNTFRLMLAGAGEVWSGKKVFQQIPRLSEHLTPGGNFAPEALIRAWEALDDFAGRVRAAGAARVLAGATMAARLALDGPDFIAAIRARYGWEAVILSGDEEARLTATGVLAGLSSAPERSLIFDIGGRSTEFISAAGRSLTGSRSLAMGVVALTEDFLSDPVLPGQLEKVAGAVREVMRKADFSGRPPKVSAPVENDSGPGGRQLAASMPEPDFTLVGTAGTVTTVAALLLKLSAYDPDLVNNARLGRAEIAELLETTAGQTNAERVKNYGLHPRRADAIVAGLVMVLEIMDFFGQRDLLVSDNGLLEGVWLKAAGLGLMAGPDR